MNHSIEDTIKIIEAEIKEKQSALKVLYQMVNKPMPPASGNGEVKIESTLFVDDTNGIKQFPKSARTDKQVAYLFDNVFIRAQKFSTIQKKFNELFGSEKNVYNVCRSLKKMGILATVQYNKQNKLSFWGKQSWVGERDFKEAFKPDPDEMPIEVNDIKILVDDDLDTL